MFSCCFSKTHSAMYVVPILFNLFQRTDIWGSQICFVLNGEGERLVALTGKDISWVATGRCVDAVDVVLTSCKSISGWRLASLTNQSDCEPHSHGVICRCCCAESVNCRVGLLKVYCLQKEESSAGFRKSIKYLKRDFIQNVAR